MAEKNFTSRSFRHLVGPLVVSSFVLFALTGKISGQSLPPAEYALKAVFLYNFTNFVAWPDTAFADSQSAIVIGVLGDDPYGIYLDETVRNELVNNRPLEVKRFSRTDEVKECHVLYISNSEEAHARQIVDSLKDRSILTVSDADGFNDAGVMIRFATEKKKIRLKIDVEAAKRAELAISSKLLRLAEIVKPRKD